MRKIFLFMNVSLDGYYEGPEHDISGFHNDFEAFSSGESQQVDALLFGHRTYEMMKFWSTPQGAERAPEIAQFMNERQKFVASHQPFEPGWNKVTVLSADVPGAVRQLKEEPGKTIAIFGSNNLVVSLMEKDLIDEFQIMVNPVAFGAGTSLFKGLTKKAALRLADTHPFKSGAVLLTYRLS
jgi:dihydrofolate reductase